MHPLDALTADEMAAAIAVLRGSGRLGERARFHRVARHEPPKDEWLGYADGDPIDRRVDVVVHDAAVRPRTVSEVVVSVTKAEIVTWRDVEGVVPQVGLMEFDEATRAVRADPGWQAAMRRRGVADPSSCQVDMWPSGNFGLPFEAGRRVMRGLAFERPDKTDNGYARHVEGVVAFVDLDEMRVIHLWDEGEWKVSTVDANYDEASVGGYRPDLKPISITQPEGTSITVDGNRLRWQRWDLRVLMDPTEGLVITDVAYDDRGRRRRILDRASLAEMVVPYGEVRPAHSFKNAFDAGEIGLGRLVNSLELGCDCLGVIHYLDAAFATDTGDPYVVPQAICVHEEDYGIGWKHFDYTTETAEVRRQRRLVVSSTHTLGNYDYGFFWYFYLDGTIQMEVKLTGVISPMGWQPGDSMRHANPVTPEVAGAHHQHLFCFRLDLSVDGPANSVVEVDVVPCEPGPDNPLLNAFEARETVLISEAVGVRDIDPFRSRSWRVINPHVTNAIGRPVGYKLMPQASPVMLAHPDSSVGRRAGFARHHLWVTPYSPDERFAAGPYPSQHAGGAGLPQYVADDRSLVDTDLVLWHTFGLTHLARPEDWPVMPVEYCGFHLMPFGFFDRNPALDVPPGAASGASPHCH